MGLAGQAALASLASDIHQTLVVKTMTDNDQVNGTGRKGNDGERNRKREHAVRHRIVAPERQTLRRYLCPLRASHPLPGREDQFPSGIGGGV